MNYSTDILKNQNKNPTKVGFRKRINSINENRIQRPILVAFEQDKERLQMQERV